MTGPELGKGLVEFTPTLPTSVIDAAENLLREIERRRPSAPLHETNILWYSRLLREALIERRAAPAVSQGAPMSVPEVRNVVIAKNLDADGNVLVSGELLQSEP